MQPASILGTSPAPRAGEYNRFFLWATCLVAALGDKPWRPCAWHWQGMWQQQMSLARQVGAGVGVSSVWAEFTGLTSVDETAKARYLTDIAALF